MVIERTINQIYKPYEKALDRVIEKRMLEKVHIKRLKKLVKKLQKGTGYTPQTEKELKKDIPDIINRLEKKQATSKDRTFIKEQFMPFVQYIKIGEKQRLMEERGIL